MSVKAKNDFEESFLYPFTIDIGRNSSQRNSHILLKGFLFHFLSRCE